MEGEGCTVVIGRDGARCERPVFAGGLCEAHHAQAIPWVGMTDAERAALDPRVRREGCVVGIDAQGTLCGRPTIAGGLCEAHYQQQRRYGHPIAGVPLRRQHRRQHDNAPTCRCCGEPNDAKGGHGLRHACYMQWWRAGSPKTWKGIAIFEDDEVGDGQRHPVSAGA